jgi:hypothetical protein
MLVPFLCYQVSVGSSIRELLGDKCLAGCQQVCDIVRTIFCMQLSSMVFLSRGVPRASVLRSFFKLTKLPINFLALLQTKKDYLI